IDWVTISSFATAGGTLVLAVATFASVRSANAAARVAERSLQANLRPVLVQSRLDDTAQKMRWFDDHWASVGGSQALAELVDGKIYLAMSLRNVGSGMAILHGWALRSEITWGMNEHTDLSAFRMQTRDLYVPPGDTGFWQAAIRDADDPDHAALCTVIENREPFLIEILYGDHEGGQRTISRFGVFPYSTEASTAWLASVNRHWNLDGPDPR
ncbi:MAG TPA: hypothetical protein VE991_03775, partial [Acidimicrobiales bacterium]|nr:hypothetical protein [Acidimicrobiales bacterium]